ncbi:MAG: helix-turn-helix domain-containing protein [Ruminococcaceae bacterium]|nr:helix-turn-helix domain-containing protein [Oscillospiraceae bacterium]
MKTISDTLPPHLDLHFHMCGTTYPHRNYFINRPASGICCIEYIVSGRGHVQIGEQRFSPCAGDTYFLLQGLDQFYSSDKKSPWEKIWINLSGSFVTRLAEAYGVQNIFHFPKLDVSDLLQKFQYYATHPETPNAAEKCTALVHDVFFRMSQSLCSEAEAEKTPVQAMLDYIDRHETDVIRLEQLAQVCHKSPSQAERLFRAELGMPPYRYVLKRKIELACQLLIETGMSVRDVASYLGFEDEFYFSGLLRRKIGLSPSQYRAQHTTGGDGIKESPSI